MIRFGLFAVRTDIFVIVLSIILFTIQIVLCSNVKSKVVRLIPVYAFSLLTLFFVILALLHTDWNKFGYFILAVFTAILLLICGIAWFVYWIIKCRKQK